MNLDDRLDRARDELADEVASDVRVPSFAGVLARRARRRRLQMTAGGVAIAVVAAGVVGGVAATRPGEHRSVPPATTVSVSPSPTESVAPTTAPSDAQTYPARGSSYVVVPDQGKFLWTDLRTGAQGHFGSGGLEPSVSADGRRVAYATSSNGGSTIEVWNLDTRTRVTIASATPLGVERPAISPDGTHVAFLMVGTGIEVAKIGSSATPKTVAPNADVATWLGNSTLAYVAGSRDCAVEQTTLSMPSTHCLLPTATLQSLPAPNGGSWSVTGLSAASGTNLIALNVMAQAEGGSIAQAVAILDPTAEATPFRVLPATVDEVTVSGNTPSFAYFSQLIDGGRQVVYVKTQGEGQDPAVSTVFSAAVEGGRPTTVTSGIYGVGLGATSG